MDLFTTRRLLARHVPGYPLHQRSYPSSVGLSIALVDRHSWLAASCQMKNARGDLRSNQEYAESLQRCMKLGARTLAS